MLSLKYEAIFPLKVCQPFSYFLSIFFHITAILFSKKYVSYFIFRKVRHPFYFLESMSSILFSGKYVSHFFFHKVYLTFYIPDQRVSYFNFQTTYHHFISFSKKSLSAIFYFLPLRAYPSQSLQTLIDTADLSRNNCLVINKSIITDIIEKVIFFMALRSKRKNFARKKMSKFIIFENAPT